MQKQRQSDSIIIGTSNIHTGNTDPGRTTYRCGLNNPGILQGGIVLKEMEKQRQTPFSPFIVLINSGSM